MRREATGLYTNVIFLVYSPRQLPHYVVHLSVGEQSKSSFHELFSMVRQVPHDDNVHSIRVHEKSLGLNLG